MSYTKFNKYFYTIHINIYIIIIEVYNINIDVSLSFLYINSVKWPPSRSYSATWRSASVGTCPRKCCCTHWCSVTRCTLITAPRSLNVHYFCLYSLLRNTTPHFALLPEWGNVSNEFYWVEIDTITIAFSARQLHYDGLYN